MSICNTCTRLNEISLCTDSIYLGTVEAFSEPYNIYFKNLGNGEIQNFVATSSPTGDLTLTPLYGFSFATNTLYELWINQADDINEREILTIDTIQATCYNVSFIRVKDTSYTTQTLSIA